NADLREAFGIEEGEELTDAQLLQLAQHYYAYGYNEKREGKPAEYEPEDPNTGETFTLTTKLDALVGTAGNDTFVGTLDAAAGASTINVGDSVDGAGGTDTFKLSSNVAAATNNNTGLTLKNIENVEISNLVAGAPNLHTFNAANASG